MRIAFSLFVALVLAIHPVFASGDLGISDDAMVFSPTSGAIEGDTIFIYVTARNYAEEDLLGTVKFFVNGDQVSSDQPVSVKQGSIPDEVFIAWTATAGTHTVEAQLTPFDSDGDIASNNTVRATYFVDSDTDGDGVGDLVDVDDDNDGLNDSEEEAIGTNTKDVDTDNDNVGDASDEFPLDDSEWADADDDGIGDNADTDDDNDNVQDDREALLGTNPNDTDSDDDGCDDGSDLFPTNASECLDGDGDGVGDNSDLFPNDPNEHSDTDGDGIPDGRDPDDDNDSFCDEPRAVDGVCGLNGDGSADHFRLDPSEWYDLDGDTLGDNRDPDDDGDTYCDVIHNLQNCVLNVDGSGDHFYRDVTEWYDADGDGVGDNADPNDNNQSPLPRMGGDRWVTVGVEEVFDGRDSVDVDGEILSYVWDFGDGTPPVEDPLVPHVFKKLGIYTVRLTITDDAGEKRVGEVAVTVENPPYLERGLMMLMWLLLLILLYIIWRTIEERRRQMRKQAEKSKRK